MIADIHNLAENMITFREMRNRTDYQIPPQGSPTNISSPEKLFPLFRERIEGHIASEDVEERDSESTPTIRERCCLLAILAIQIHAEMAVAEQS